MIALFNVKSGPQVFVLFVELLGSNARTYPYYDQLIKTLDTLSLVGRNFLLVSSPSHYCAAAIVPK